MFKVGDKVRVIAKSEYKEEHDPVIGWETEIIGEYDELSVVVKRDDMYGHRGHIFGEVNGWEIKKNRLELISKDEEKAAEPAKEDVVNHPSHYKAGGIETIDFIESKGLDYYLGNTVKYISRAGKKDPAKELQDLEKAAWYLNRKIQKMKEAKNES